MNKKSKLTFLKAEFLQYNYILKDNQINDKVSSFLLSYVSIEAFYKKMLVAEREERNGSALTKKEIKSLRVTSGDAIRVLSWLGIEFESEIIERIFGSQNSNYYSCSIKKLRDRLVHNINDNVIRVILSRYDQMMEDMHYFISLFEL